VVFTEFINNLDKYSPAFGSKLTYIKQLNSYLIRKQFNHTFGDIVPNVLANGLNLRLNILDVHSNDLVRETLIKPFDDLAINEISIKLQNKHYDGIAPGGTLQSAPPEPASLINDVVVAIEQGDVLMPPQGDVLIPPQGDVLIPPIAFTSNDVANDVVSPHFDGTALYNLSPPQPEVARLQDTSDIGRLTYSRASLLEHQNFNRTNRSVRRRAFYLGINRISHNPSPTCIVIPTENWSTPRLMLTNPTSLTNKIDELRVMANQHHSDIVAVCESWLTPEMPIEPYLLHGYHTPIRRERIGRRGGGVLCYVNERLPMREWSDLCDPDIESVWFTIFPQRLPRQHSVISCGVIYHPPGHNHKNLTHHIQKCCDTLILKYPETGIVIMGDFNEYKTSMIQSNYNLKQLVRQPTFLSKTLDKIMTNMHEMYCTPSVLAPIGSLDRGHCVVVCDPLNNYKAKPVLTTSQIRDQRPGNCIKLGEAIARYPWHLLYQLPTCAAQFDFYQTSLESLIDEHLPWKTVTRSSNDPPWINDNFKNLILKRDNAYKNKQNEYRHLKTQVRREGRSLKKKFYKKSIEELESNRLSQSKKWWDVTKKLMGKKTNNSDAMFHALAKTECDGNIQALAETINTAFGSVNDDLQPLTTDDRPLMDDHSVQIYIEPKDVLNKLLTLDVKKAPGPDGILTWVLKNLADVLAAPLCAVFNSSLREGFVPPLWKCADIVCIPKKSPPQCINSDFRPISLLPVASKQLEYHVGRKIWDIIGPQIRTNQYGGLQNSSCVLALIDMLNSWHNAAARKKMARVLLLDYRKAFDHISHQLILSKLKDYHVPDNLINWVWSYLSDRKQRVKVASHYSSWQPITGGVPQGSWLGPVLFVLVIDDLEIDDVSVIKYMDDTSVTEICDGESKMQECLNNVQEWSSANKMQLNPTKTKEMCIDFSRRDSPTALVTSEGEKIELVEHSKLLGLTVQSNLRWDKHISDITRKAATKIHFLIGLKRSGYHERELVTYFAAYIRSQLEYAAAVFHPGLTIQQSEALEMVQIRALAVIYPSINYPEALRTAGLQKLSVRRTNMCFELFQQIQHESHRLHKLLPPKVKPSYKLRKNRKFSSNTKPSARMSKEYITFCVDNFNYE